MSEQYSTESDATVTVSLEDLRAVLDAVDYMADRSLIGPVDRLGDAVALATMRRDTERETRVIPPGEDPHYCPTCDHPWGYHHAERGCTMPLDRDGLPIMRTDQEVRRCACRVIPPGETR